MGGLFSARTHLELRLSMSMSASLVQGGWMDSMNQINLDDTEQAPNFAPFHSALNELFENGPLRKTGINAD